MDVKTCPSCGQTLSKTSFYTRSTAAQARAWLKNPAAKPIQYEGKVCKDCRLKRKRSVKPPTPEQLRRRLISERTKPAFVIEQLVSERKAKGTAWKSKTAIANLRARRKPLFDAQYAELNTLAQLIRMRMAYEKDAEGGMMMFLLVAKNVVRQTRYRLRAYQTQGKNPPTERWYEYVRDEDKQGMLRTYGALPPELKHRVAPLMERMGMFKFETAGVSKSAGTVGRSSFQGDENE